ncbi:hypothetical protein A7982_13629 [Minicystis rosea]|nr:hypothetical protein A7982_13629 [Minicystis rosea]
MRVRRISRFDISRADGAVTFTAEHDGDHGLVHRIRIVSFVLLVAVPLFFALVAPEEEIVSVFAVLFLGMAPAIADLLNTSRYRIFRAPPWSFVRRSLVVLPPTEGDHRHAPTGLRLLVDGAPIEVTDPARILVSTSVIVMQQNGFTQTRIRHHVDLVFARSVVRVDTTEELEDAADVGRALHDAMGLDEDALEVGLTTPFESTGAGMALGVVSVLVQVAAIIAAMVWAMASDFADRGTTRLALAALVVAALEALVQETTYSFSAAAQASKTADGYNVQIEPAPLRRRARIGFAVTVAALVAAAGLGLYTTGTQPHRADFTPGGERLTLVDIDGVPTPVGFSLGHLDAIDPRNGQRRWSIPLDHGSQSNLVIRGSLGLVHGDSAFLAFDPGSGRVLWKADAPSRFSSFFFHKGCIAFRNGLQVRSIDERTGEACAALAWASAETDDDDAHREAREALFAAENAQREAERSARAARSTRKVDGVEYAVDTVNKQLVVTASRAGTRLFRTELPASPLSRTPFAVGDGLVLIAGTSLGHRGGAARLRLVGLDAATGKIRFVEHHPAVDGGYTDVAVTGGVGVVAWAYELFGVSPTTGKVVWRVR